jgi:energy-coupling factor transporter ATP-binding protein EcfA2
VKHAGHGAPQSIGFENYHATWREHALRGITTEVTAERLACVGSWQALGAHLAGAPDVVVSGSVRFDRKEQRALVRNGGVGVARAEQILPASDSVDGWLAEAAILNGTPAKQAARAAKLQLTDLSLGFLASRSFDSLSLAERYGALVACALSTAPLLVWLPEPRVPKPLMPFCRDLLARVAERAQVALVFSGEPDLDLLLWCDHVLAIRNGTLTANCSVASWLAQGVHYRLTPLTAGAQQPGSGNPALEARLREAGVAIHNPGREQLFVSVPEPGSTDCVLRACLDSALGLYELTPLFFGPSTG